MAESSSLDSKTLTNYLCITAGAGVDQLQIECNFCSTDDYMFFDGTREESTETDWLAVAVSHIKRWHKELEELE